MFSGTGINAIYATQFKRTQETVKPLAEQTGLQPHIVDAKNTAEVVDQILTQHRGETILLAGHSDTVPQIVTALGGPTLATIPDSEYDNIFVVTVYRFGKAKVVKMKYGAASTQGTGTMMR